MMQYKHCCFKVNHLTSEIFGDRKGILIHFSKSKIKVSSLMT